MTLSSVFVLRCRDVDSLVRTDCIHELGRWMEANQEQFVTSTYLPYLGWALSDRTAGVRLESLKVLTKLHEIDNQPNDLRQFTSRFTHRYIEMAIGEADIAARMAAIRVVTLVQKHGQLEEEDQVKLSTLIYGANPKIRKSMAKFVKARVWEDEVESRLAACQVLVNSSKGDKVEIKKEWVELKSLAIFLIKVGKSDSESTERVDPRLIDETKVGRIALAVEALWSEFESLKVTVANFWIFGCGSNYQTEAKLTLSFFSIVVRTGNRWQSTWHWTTLWHLRTLVGRPSQSRWRTVTTWRKRKKTFCWRCLLPAFN